MDKLFKNHPNLSSLKEEIYQTLNLLDECVRSSNKIIISNYGNLSSLVNHLVNMFLSGRVYSEDYSNNSDEPFQLREGIPAISILDNGHNAECPLGQQISVLAQENDLFWALISSKPDSMELEKLLWGLQVANQKKMKVIVFTSFYKEKFQMFSDLVLPIDFGNYTKNYEVFHTLAMAVLNYFVSKKSCSKLFLRNEEKNYLKENSLPKKIDLVVFDFDGVFTDNKVIVSQTGEEHVVCNRGDGLGINFLQKLKVPMIILSTEKNPVVAARARKMGLSVEYGCNNKYDFLKQYFSKNGIDPMSVIYMGNDINDIEAMKMVGYSVVPFDAHPEVKKVASLILHVSGGQGAVRALCELIVNR